jgi:hypothetical protein
MRRLVPLLLVVFLALLSLIGAGGRGSAQIGEAAGATPEPALALARSLDVSADCAQLALGTPVPRQPAPDPTPRSSLTLEFIDIGFAPCAFTIPAHTPVPITFTNTSQIIGNFTIDELAIQSPTLLPGETIELELNAPPGAYAFYSDLPGHREAGAAGILTVVGNESATPTALATETLEP